MKPMYKRVLLKLSGEALSGDKGFGINNDVVNEIAVAIKKIQEVGVEVSVVVGGGNFWRGRTSEGMDRTTADYIGMLATVMNSLALKEYFNAAGVPAIVQSSFAVDGIVPKFNRETAVNALNDGSIVIFAGGTGNPFFTTDTASVVRALEIDCDAVLKATKVNGVYSADPMKDPNATRFEEISFDKALEMRLKIMDATAFSLCRDNKLPIIVFNFAQPGSLDKIISGDCSVGTIVS